MVPCGVVRGRLERSRSPLSPSDRRRRIHLCEAALSEVKAHSTCWSAVLDAPIHDGRRAQSTLERWHQVHGLLEKGVGLLECARRLQLAPTLSTTENETGPFTGQTPSATTCSSAAPAPTERLGWPSVRSPPG